MYKVSGNLNSAYGSDLEPSSAPIKSNVGLDMPHVTSSGRRMTNIPVGNGEYVQGIRKNESLNIDDRGSKLPDLSPPHGMRPLRYTAGLACDADLERLRPERDMKHKPFTGPEQQQWRKKLIQHPSTYDGSFVDADMQQFRPSPNPPVTQDPWYASRLPEGQYYPANERLAGPGALPSVGGNPYDSIYPQDELSRIKERNRRFANTCGQEVMAGPVSAQMGPYGYGAPPAVMPSYHMPMMQPMMQPFPGMMPQQMPQPPFYPPNQPNYAMPPPLINQMDELRLLDNELDATRRVTRPFVPQGDHFGDLQRERQSLEDSSQVIAPIMRRPQVQIELPTSIDQLPAPKKNVGPKRNESAQQDLPKPKRQPEVRIADQIAIRSIVLGNSIPTIGGSKASSARASNVVSPTGSSARVISPSGSQQRVVSPTGSNGSGVRSPKFSTNEILEEEE